MREGIKALMRVARPADIDWSRIQRVKQRSLAVPEVLRTGDATFRRFSLVLKLFSEIDPVEATRWWAVRCWLLEFVRCSYV